MRVSGPHRADSMVIGGAVASRSAPRTLPDGAGDTWPGCRPDEPRRSRRFPIGGPVRFWTCDTRTDAVLQMESSHRSFTSLWERKVVAFAPIRSATSTTTARKRCRQRPGRQCDLSRPSLRTICTSGATTPGFPADLVTCSDAPFIRVRLAGNLQSGPQGQLALGSRPFDDRSCHPWAPPSVGAELASETVRIHRGKTTFSKGRQPGNVSALHPHQSSCTDDVLCPEPSGAAGG
jgi:hypothetical protein